MSKILERIKKEKIAVNCKTVEELARLMVLTGQNWNQTPEYFFKIHKENTTVEFFMGSFSYSEVGFIKKKKYAIMQAKDFLAEYDSEHKGEVAETGKKDTVLQGYLKNLLRTQNNIANMDAPETKAIIGELIKDITGLLPTERNQIEAAFQQGFGVGKTPTKVDLSSDYFTQTYNEGI